MKSSFLTICLSLLFITSTIFAQEVPSWLHGTWEGVGYQSPTNSAWRIELNYNVTNQAFIISYPSLECSGNWKLLESEENRLIFVEQINEGLDNCDNNVKVIVTYVDEDYISVAYFIPKVIDNVVAYAVMKRKKKKIKKT